jgi:hypothetical protein
MHRLALVLASLLAPGIGCSKAEKPPEPKDPYVVKGPVAASADPATLPPPGKAPTPATVDKELSMWNVRSDPRWRRKLADYKGKTRARERREKLG